MLLETVDLCLNDNDSARDLHELKLNHPEILRDAELALLLRMFVDRKNNQSNRQTSKTSVDEAIGKEQLPPPSKFVKRPRNQASNLSNSKYFDFQKMNE
jgi:hypothetical protein